MTVVLALLLLVTASNKDRSMDELKKRIVDTLSATQGTFAVAMEDLSTGRQLLFNEREMFHAASTMKTPVLIELYKQVHRGTIRLSDSVTVANSFKSIVDGSPYSLDLNDDSDDSIYGKIGTKMTIRQLMDHMITVSSNLATNILIEIAGASNVTATMRTLGADSIQVRRGVEDQKAYDTGLNNVTSAYDLMVIMKAIATGKAADSLGCEDMMAILGRQKLNDIIPALLPVGTRVAHKTGSITNIEHDSGVVTLPDGRRYVLVLLSKNLKNNKEGKVVFARVSKEIYDFLESEGGR